MSHRTPWIALAIAISLLVGSPALAGNGKNNKQAAAAELATNEAVAAMRAGGNTIAGPGFFMANKGGHRIVYAVVSGAAPDVCITMRNRETSVGLRVAIRVTGEPEEDAFPVGVTATRCYAAPTEIRLRCGGDGRGGSCKAVWRVDAL